MIDPVDALRAKLTEPQPDPLCVADFYPLMDRDWVHGMFVCHAHPEMTEVGQ